MFTLTLSGGDIFANGVNVGSVYEAPEAANLEIIAHPPPTGQSFSGWIGDTANVENLNTVKTSVYVNANISVQASFTNTGTPIDGSDFATLDAKLDAIQVDLDTLTAGGN